MDAQSRARAVGQDANDGTALIIVSASKASSRHANRRFQPNDTATSIIMNI